MNNTTLHIKTLLLASLLLLVGPSFGQPAPPYQPPPLSVEFVPEAGFFADSVGVQLLAPGAAIYFTTDGSQPRPEAMHRYTGPVPITQNTVLRAIAVLAGERSPVLSASYFIDEPESTLPVVSLSIEPDRLFDPQRGLFQMGENAVDSIWYRPGANFWSRQELAASVEFFETDGQLRWKGQTGFRLFGGMSRLFPQKSLALVARKRYGDKRIRHRVFGKKNRKKFKFLVLRNSGSDFGKSHFRDALMTDLVKDWGLDVQDYRPAQVYINGQYWGIYNLREKINRYFIAQHHGVDKDSIDLLEHRLSRRNGSSRHYRALLEFLENNDLSDPVNYAYLCSQMEVDNFINYQVAQIYFDNWDAGGNIKFWRPQTPDGRWRWILYDTDYGFGLNGDDAYRNNSLAFHTQPDGPKWPNPPWSTFILRKLLENKDFERQFVSTFADHLNHDLCEKEVTRTVDKFYQRLLPEMPRHLQRWNLRPDGWEAEVAELRTFGKERPRYLRRFLEQRFDLGEQRTLILQTSPGGEVVINERYTVRGVFPAKYFEKIPVRLRAKPDLGYRFVRWEGEGIRTESPELHLEILRSGWQVQAVFEKYEHSLRDYVVVNELSCNNKQSEDWIEIYNRSRERVNLKGWILTDSKNEFVFPEYTLPPKGYVVLCEDSVSFLKTHPQVQSLIGGLNFGLNKRHETIQLFTPDAAAVDSMAYDLSPMDSVFALSLLLPDLDNGDPENWSVNFGTGSPGAANAYYVSSSIQAQRSQYMQMGAAAGVIVVCLILLRLRHRGRLSF